MAAHVCFVSSSHAPRRIPGSATWPPSSGVPPPLANPPDTTPSASAYAIPPSCLQESMPRPTAAPSEKAPYSPGALKLPTHLEKFLRRHARHQPQRLPIRRLLLLIHCFAHPSRCLHNNSK